MANKPAITGAGVSPERSLESDQVPWETWTIRDFKSMILVDCGWYLSGIGIYDLVDLTLAKQPVLARVQRAWTRTSLQVRTAAQCSSPAPLVQSVRDDTTEREIELAG